MNGTHESLCELVKLLNDSHLDPNTETVIAPPSLYRARVLRWLPTRRSRMER